MNRPLHRFTPKKLTQAISGLPFLLCATTGSAAPEHEQHLTVIEEVVVTGELQKKLADTALPINVLSGEQLNNDLANTLGDTIDSLPGVQSSSFGAGVGRPIIRGQSGNRVRVLQNGINTLDASSVSPDHANGVNPFAAERIEVLRGPATLLYGNGAIGGVVNVLDKRIASQPLEETSARILQSHDTNNDQNTTAFTLDAPAGNFAVHADGTIFNGNDVEIPDGNFLPPFQDEDTTGRLRNSNFDGKSGGLGATYFFDSGYIGIAVSDLQQEYGLPPAPPGVSDEEGVDIRIDLDQTRYEIETGWLLNGFFNELNAHIGFTDYEHREIEIEPEEEFAEDEGDGEEEIGTRFFNEGFDSRFTLKHGSPNSQHGVLGVQIQDREFGSEGGEGYILPTDIRSFAVFALEGFEYKQLQLELGARIERTDTELSSGCDQSETTFSASASALRDISDSANVWISASLSERAATEEELFSNVSDSTCTNFAEQDLIEHAATRRIEIGNPDLDTETSRNIEVGLRKHSGEWTGEINVFYNNIRDYIFAGFTDDPEVIRYNQQDADFYGIEAEFTQHLFRDSNQHFDLRVFGDYVQGELDDGEDVPRLAPARLGAELSWARNRWFAQLSSVQVFDQSRTSNNETKTDGYNRLEALIEYNLPINDSNLAIYSKGKNLLDEDIRDHTSFTKDSAPAAGIGAEVGLRFTF